MGGRLLTLIGSFLVFCALLAAVGCSGLGEKSSGAPYNGTNIGTGTGGIGIGTGTQQPPTNAGDKYAAVGTNPFVTTSYDPLSTFAVDVDTASYDILRRDVNLGMLPQPASVRLEEYVNDFSYDYAAPKNGEPVAFIAAR